MCGRGFEQQEQHPGSWLAPHSCADRSGAALHTVTGCSCPPVPSMPFYFFDWYLTKLHTSIPKDWGPLFLLSQTSTLRQLPGTPVWDFLQRVLGLIQTQPHRAKGFPHTVLSEDLSSSPVSLPPRQADTSWRCQESAVLPQNSNLSPPQCEPVTFPIISTDLQGVNLGYGL